MQSCILFALTSYLVVISPAVAFSVGRRFENNAGRSLNTRHEFSNTKLDMFGKAFSDAFSNDKNLGKAENAGLKGGPKMNENVVING